MDTLCDKPVADTHTLNVAYAIARHLFVYVTQED